MVRGIDRILHRHRSPSPKDGLSAPSIENDSETAKIDREIKVSCNSLAVSLKSLGVEGHLWRTRADLSWPLNQGAVNAYASDGTARIEWVEGGLSQLLRLDAAESSFAWRSRSIKYESDVTANEVRGMGRVDCESGMIYEKTSEPKIWTKKDLKALKKARADEIRLLASGKKTCHRQLDHIHLMIDAVMESGQFVEEIITVRDSRPATLADLENTRGWQIMKRVEVSLFQAAQAKTSQS